MNKHNILLGLTLLTTCIAMPLVAMNGLTEEEQLQRNAQEFYEQEDRELAQALEASLQIDEEEEYQRALQLSLENYERAQAMNNAEADEGTIPASRARVATPPGAIAALLAEQDAAYQRSLLADQARERAEQERQKDGSTSTALVLAQGKEPINPRENSKADATQSSSANPLSPEESARMREVRLKRFQNKTNSTEK